MRKFKKLLKITFDIGMYLNILALLPQPIQMFLSETSEGVSVWTWILFFIFQLAMSLHGKLNIKSSSMFFGMGGSAFISLSVIILYFIF